LRRREEEEEEGGGWVGVCIHMLIFKSKDFTE